MQVAIGNFRRIDIALVCILIYLSFEVERPGGQIFYGYVYGKILEKKI